MDYIELEVEKILWHTLCEILGTPLPGSHIYHYVVWPPNHIFLRQYHLET